LRDIRLRPIKYEDIEKLRIWRNENRDAFFCNETISKEEQVKWFKRYLEYKNIRLFIIEYQDKDIGCMGYQPFGKFIELYNVILGDKEYEKQGLMSEALQLLLAKIDGKVLEE